MLHTLKLSAKTSIKVKTVSPTSFAKAPSTFECSAISAGEHAGGDWMGGMICTGVDGPDTVRDGGSVGRRRHNNRHFSTITNYDIIGEKSVKSLSSRYADFINPAFL